MIHTHACILYSLYLVIFLYNIIRYYNFVSTVKVNKFVLTSYYYIK